MADKSQTATMGGALSAALMAEVKGQASSSFEFELGGQAFRLGAKPITPADFNKVNRMIKASFQQDPTNFEGMVQMIILKAQVVDDEDTLTNAKAFATSDKPVLNRLGFRKITDLFQGLFGDDLEEVDEGDEVAEGVTAQMGN